MRQTHRSEQYYIDKTKNYLLQKIQYDQLVIATGLKEDSSVKGLEEAWADPQHPFYTCTDHPSWKNSSTSAYRWLHNFEGGEAIFYIPPYPFHT